MGEIIRRPVSSVDWGTVSNQGTGNILGDNNVNTIKWYKENSGSVLVFPKFTDADMPYDDIVAVGVGFRQVNGGFLGLYDGWVRGFIHIDGEREAGTLTYVQDRYSFTGRHIKGPVFFKSGGAPFEAVDIDRMAMDVGSAVGTIGPKRGKYWCGCGEAYIILYTAEDPRVPTMRDPANGQNLNSSSVNFTARINAPEFLQSQAIFQVARDTAFTEEVQEFEGSFFDPNDEFKDSKYTSVYGRDSYTDLGPGRWYVRAKTRDYRGLESAWSSYYTFSITLAALPDSFPGAPATNSVVRTPYGVRSALLGGVTGTGANVKRPMPGFRKAGTRFQFSKDVNFLTGVVEWANINDGVYFLGTVSYDAHPNPAIEAGKNGYNVSFDDPSQYLSQGTWYMRTRTEDRYGNTSAWLPGAGVQQFQIFTVSHQPVADNLIPTGGEKFDLQTRDLTWDFVDPWENDEQTEYRVIIQRANDVDHVVWDSGWIASSARRVRPEVDTSYHGENLRWVVQVADIDGVRSVASLARYFTYEHVPNVAIHKPADVVNTGRPQIAWSASIPRSGVTNVSYRITVVDLEDMSIAYDSGTVVSDDASHTPTVPILRDGHIYRLTVFVTNSSEQTGTMSKEITAQFVRPPAVPVVIDSTHYEEEGFIVARWRQEPDPFFSQWRLYRRVRGATEWQLAAETNDASARTLRDWLVSGSGVIEYYLAEVVSRYGSLIETQEQRPLQTATLSYSTYLLAVPSIGFSLVVKPTADSYTVTQESSVIRIMGRGDKVNFGGARGREGSLTVHLRNPSTAIQTRKIIDSLIGSVEQVWLRDPFGDAFKVALSEYSFERLAGVGPSDLGDLDIPYVEVVE